MSDPFIGEIRMFAGNYAPKNWAFCDGQQLAVNSNDALFSLIGATYGGDGRTSFALPDLRGRLPIHQGQGPGLTRRTLGSQLGVETVRLSSEEMPSHNHTLKASTVIANASQPTGQVLAAQNDGDQHYILSPTPSRLEAMNAETVATQGADEAHFNMMPYSCVNFIIATLGQYPSRN
ncbi:phage tail protein [Thalassotalea sp. PLHSN55]|uniref:phage tail protein n=1 Tax=Thalassotalea sp. PLHSN55 TaxID=3435888 RepID=UPI003F8481DC